MEHQVKVKTIFEVETLRKEFYTGGLVQITQDGKTLLCQCSNHIAIVDVEQALITQTIPPNLTYFNPCNDENIIEDQVLSFTLSSDEELLATGHKSGLIKLWNWKSSELITAWKSGHKGPICILAFNRNNFYLTSGSTDSILRVWNIENHSCDFKLGGLTGVTSILMYRTIEGEEYLFASGDEAVIRVWHLQKNKEHHLIYKLTGHFSKITKILFTSDNVNLLSCSRDKAVILWDLPSRKQIKIIPVYESLEAAVLLPNCINLPGYEKPLVGLIAAFGGENGKIRIWNVTASKELYVSEANSKSSIPINHLIYDECSQSLIEVSANHNVCFYKLDCSFSCRKQMIGYLDEILDIVFFGENENFLAVATNSCDIHIYDENMNCFLAKGHTDLVVSLATSCISPNLLASGSKDNSIRVWMMKDNVLNCVAVGARHTASVGAVSLSSTSLNSFMVSASEDCTLKLWPLPVLKYKKCETLIIGWTEVAHEKPINSICLSPNSELIGTGSQDKTAKIWSTTNLSLLGILRGHRRAVWCVKFSPVDQVLLTSSADATLRLWSLTDFSCLKTLEGQDCSILNCSFINNGSQIVSSGTDGLIKIWLIKSGECVSTLDKHAARIWALAVSSDESTIVSGGADSRIIFWKDKTVETHLEELKANQEKVEQEQHLANLLKAEKLLPALQYAIKLNRPLQVLKIIENVVQENMDGLKNVVDQLNVDEKESLLGYVTEWNTNSKHSYIAQLILSFLINEVMANKLKISNNQLEALIAYTNRHYDRMVSHMEDIQLVFYTVKMMEPYNV